MPRSSLHTLVWSQEHSLYELYTRGQLQHCFRREESEAWLRWLAAQMAFAFYGAAGHLNVHQERRPRGGSYWYAYHVKAGHTSKRYLGHTSKVTFPRLEAVAQSLSSESMPTLPKAGRPVPSQEEDVLGGEVLMSKLAHPLLPPSLVTRQRLLTQLDQAVVYRLTVLSASAGWGKTTVLALWAERSAHPVAWLSLDDLDNDPARFWLSVLAALRTCLPGVGESALTLLCSPQAPPLTTILLKLLNELSRLAEPTILLLDDYHLISEPTVHDSLLFVLEHLPPQLHLVLSSRIDLPLALSRWRVRGYLLELRDADLRFEEQEAGQFLRETMQLALSEEDVAALTRRTEGWIAGLQLAVLSLRHRQDRSAFVDHFTGMHRFVLDYIQEEILDQLPERLRDFLLQIAILPRMSASLCQAVTNDAESLNLLSHIERANLFLIPLDEERRWYRLHELFREALLARLHASMPQRVPQLHQRAARWYERQSLLREAIPHALAAQDYALAASFIERVAEALWVSGEANTVQTWIAALPDTVLITHARLALTVANNLLQSLHIVAETAYVRGRAQVEHTIARLQAALNTQEALLPSAGEKTLIQRRLWLLRAYLESRNILRQGDVERLRLLAQEAEALPLDEEEKWNMIPLSLRSWLTLTFQSEQTPLISRLLSARQRMMHKGDSLSEPRLLLFLAMAYWQQGAQWHRVEQICQQALALIEQMRWKTSTEGYFFLCLYHTYYAWNHLEKAAQAVDQVLRIAQEWQQVDLLILGWAAFVQISVARGELAAASHALQTMEDLVAQNGFANHSPWVVVSRVRVWLVQGNLAEAAHWAAQIALSPEGWKSWDVWHVFMQVRIAFAHQQYASAVEILSRFREHLDQPGYLFRKIEFLVLSVLAFYFNEQREKAESAAVRLLSLTQPEQSIRIYLDLGKPMQEVLKALLDRGANQHDDRLMVFRPFIVSVLDAFAHQEQERPATTATEPASSPGRLAPPTAPVLSLLEPLTAREQRILRLLAAGRSNQEIAQMLVISLNTVKTHLKNLYSKLQVRSRTQACALARELHLL